MAARGLKKLSDPAWVADSGTLLRGVGSGVVALGTGCSRGARLVCAAAFKYPYGVLGVLANGHQSLLVTGHAASILPDMAICRLVYSEEGNARGDLGVHRRSAFVADVSGWHVAKCAMAAFVDLGLI